MGNVLSTVFTYQLVHAAIRCSVPIIYACLACSVCKQANVFNMSVEGVMLFSCFIASSVSYLTGSWVLAVLVSVLFGILVSGLLAFGSIKLKANIVVLAIAINMLATAATRFLMPRVFGCSGSFTSKDTVPIPTVTLPIFQDNPVFTSLFNGYNLFELLCPVFIFVLWFMLYKTVWGLRLRTVGLNEMCAQTAGITADGYKVQALLIAGALGGLAGAHMSLGYVTMFAENMVQGRGFMGMAAMHFGAANPVVASLACLIFGACDALGSRVQLVGIPSQFVLMLPYIITVGVLVVAMASFARKERRIKSAKHYAAGAAKAGSKSGPSAA